MHKQPDDVWRIDFQLGWNIDRQRELEPANIRARVDAMLGPDVAYELEWCSIYTFQCRRMDRFRHGQVLFAGDAAHQVSPFGARGGNSGIQDSDNLAWKLKLVIDGLADASLLDSYSDERVAAADENLMHSTRSTDFITPKSAVSHDFRNAVLTLAQDHAFARALVNSGRLSVPTHLLDSALNTPDGDAFDGGMHPGAPLADAPVLHQGRDDWLLRHTGGHFTLLLFVPTGLDAQTLSTVVTLAQGRIALRTVLVAVADGDAPRGTALLVDTKGRVAERLDGRPGTAYLLRPDQHVAARWRQLDLHHLQAALARATATPASPA